MRVSSKGGQVKVSLRLRFYTSLHCYAEGYTATDIVARYKRMKGFNVLHPIAWDAFGLPAEQYALQTGTHPAVTTRKNIDRFREQLQSLGGKTISVSICPAYPLCSSISGLPLQKPPWILEELYFTAATSSEYAIKPE